MWKHADATDSWGREREWLKWHNFDKMSILGLWTGHVTRDKRKLLKVQKEGSNIKLNHFCQHLDHTTNKTRFILFLLLTNMMPQLVSSRTSDENLITHVQMCNCANILQKAIAVNSSLADFCPHFFGWQIGQDRQLKKGPSLTICSCQKLNHHLSPISAFNAPSGRTAAGGAAPVVLA